MSTDTGADTSSEIPQLDLSPEYLPLTTNEFGVVRITGTRIGLSTVIEAYRHKGRTPYQIAADYRLKLGVVFTVLGFYLRRKAEVDEYIEGIRRDEERIRLELEASGMSPPDWQERLRSRAEAHRARTDEPS